MESTSFQAGNPLGNAYQSAKAIKAALNPLALQEIIEMKNPRNTPAGERRAFTLIEMLGVMALLGLVIALCLPAVPDMARSSALKSGGQLVAALAAQARQAAVSKNTLAALVVLTEAGTAQDYRALALVEYSEERGWAQIGKWELLPKGVILDPQAPGSTLLTEKGAEFPLLPSGQSLPDLRFEGRKLSESQVAAILFMPSGGRRDAENPARLRLVQGLREGGRITYTNRHASGLPADYIDISVVGVTGSVKVSRPS